MAELLPVSFALLSVALVIGSGDALYFHLWKYRLYARPESRVEHLTHTVRAVLLPLTLWLGFVAERTTPVLYAFGAVELLDFGIVIWDVMVEHQSRAGLGGLSRSEYLVHIVATTLHSAAIALAFLTWPLAAWTSQRVSPFSMPALVAVPAMLLAIGAVGIAGLHLVLAHPRFVK